MADRSDNALASPQTKSPSPDLYGYQRTADTLKRVEQSVQSKRRNEMDQMDEKARHYRKRAAQLRKRADSTSDDTTRKHLIENIAEYEKMAIALDSVAPADRAHPKHPGGSV